VPALCRSHVRPLAAIVSLALLLVLATVSAVPATRGTPRLPADLPASERARCLAIAQAADVGAHVAAPPFEIRQQVFEYLLDHPVFATHVTRTLRLARYRIWRTSEGLFLDDGWGTTGRFDLVHAAPGVRVFVARGEYRKALLPSIEGEAIAMIEYHAEPRVGQDVVHTTVSGFLRLDSRLAGAALRMLSGIAERKADKEARKLMRIFAKTSRRLEEDPAGALERLRRQPDVPRAELEEFARLLSAR
jgi:hypothetical protein